MATEVAAAATGAARSDTLPDADDQASLFQSTLQSAAQPRAAAQTASQPKRPSTRPGPQPGAQPTPAGQAATLYDKFQAGSSGSEYTNQDALREIRDKYDQATKDGQNRGLKGADLKAFVVKQMTDVIQGQVDHGISISAHSYDQDPGVVLSKDLQQKLDAIGDSFKKATGRTMHVTSGIRNPEKQAAAMYAKFQLGSDGSDYGNKGALREIKNAYDQAMHAAKKHVPPLKPAELKAFVVKQMTDVIQGQVDRGTLISPHLPGNAVDIRTRDLTPDQLEALKKAVTQAGGICGRPEPHAPPHLHVQFPPERVASK